MYLNFAYCEVVYCEIHLLRTTFWSPKSHFTRLLQGFCQECLRGGVQKGWGSGGPTPGDKKSEFLNVGA